MDRDNSLYITRQEYIQTVSGWLLPAANYLVALGCGVYFGFFWSCFVYLLVLFSFVCLGFLVLFGFVLFCWLLLCLLLLLVLVGWLCFSFVFVFKYILLISLPVKPQNSIILIFEQLQPVIVVSEFSSKANHTSSKLKFSELFQGIPVETDPWAYGPMNGQVCLAAFM